MVSELGLVQGSVTAVTDWEVRAQGLDLMGAALEPAMELAQVLEGTELELWEGASESVGPVVRGLELVLEASGLTD